MTLTLELSPEVEQALQAKARRRGLALEAYLLDVAVRDAHDALDAPHVSPQQTPLGQALQQACAAREALRAATLGPLDAARDLEEVRAGE